MTLPTHMPALDALRALAIIMVLATHVGSSWAVAKSIYQYKNLGPDRFTVPGWVNDTLVECSHGVQLFFVVSAFTLTLRLSDRQGLGLYAVRRILRVGPGYWLAGLLYTLLGGFGPRLWAPDGISPWDIAVAAGFGSAWQGDAALAVVPGGWSVCCEVSFYAALPPLLWLIDNKLWRAITITALLAAIANALALHHVTPHGVPFSIFVHPIEQAPVFMLGVTAALWVRQRSSRHGAWVAPAALAAGVFLLPLSPTYAHIQPHLWFSPFAAIAVAYAAKNPPRLLQHPLAVGLGRISYSVYLVHFAVLLPSMMLVSRLAPSSGGIALALHMAIVLSASSAIATVTYHTIELPFIQAGKRWTRFVKTSRLTGG